VILLNITSFVLHKFERTTTWAESSTRKRKNMKKGEVVRVWNGQHWRVGTYQRTIERGKQIGWHVVDIKMSSGKTRKRFFPPDYVEILKKV